MPKPDLTFKQVQSSLKEQGMVLCSCDGAGDYRVAFAGLRGDLQELSAYYTADLEDALLTGLLMAQRAKEMEAARLVEAWHASQQVLATLSR